MKMFNEKYLSTFDIVMIFIADVGATYSVVYEFKIYCIIRNLFSNRNLVTLENVISLFV